MTAGKPTAVVIGAGVVGCATAYSLAARGFEVIVLEKGPRIAEGVTSRNSGVIHAGLYYSPDSLKARSCVDGNIKLYEWCTRRGVAHRKTGKWIVGSASEELELAELFENAERCDAHRGLRMATRKELSTIGGGVLKSEIGFFSAETGIVDPYEYALSFLVSAEELGAQFLMNCQVLDATEATGGGYSLKTSRGPMETDVVVNCAGLYADEIARLVGVTKYTIHPWRGDYFRVRSAPTFPGLVYPVKKKNSPGLGVHVTLALDGTVRLGPDVEIVRSKEDFAAPEGERLEQKTRLFVEAASKYWKGLKAEDLIYDTSGIRPKLRSPDDQLEKDFVVSKDKDGWVNMVGIESPGLTSAISLAEMAAHLL